MWQTFVKLTTVDIGRERENKTVILLHWLGDPYRSGPLFGRAQALLGGAHRIWNRTQIRFYFEKKTRLQIDGHSVNWLQGIFP